LVIVLVHIWHPTVGATVGASGGTFGVVGTTLVLSYRDPEFIGEASRLRMWLLLVLVIGLAVSFLPEITVWPGMSAVSSADLSWRLLRRYGKMPNQPLKPLSSLTAPLRHAFGVEP
jgi:membrane associated rhomboid family serine protease